MSNIKVGFYRRMCFKNVNGNFSGGGGVHTEGVWAAGGQLVKGAGLLSWSDLSQLFNFKETVFLSVKG